MIGRLHTHIGYRGSFLLGLATVDVVYAWVMLTMPASSSAFPWFDAVVPLQVWAGAWILVALVCLAYAFHDHHPPQADLPGFQAAMGIKVLWGLGCLLGWVMDDVAPSSAAIWLFFAFMVWRVAGWAEPHMTSEDDPHA